MSSRLAFAPDRVNASLATSKMRSRFRCASARGFRLGGCDRFVAYQKTLATGDHLRLSYVVRRHSPIYAGRVRLSIGASSSGSAGGKNMAKAFGATSTTEDVLSGMDLRGKRILVTGVSAGLGVETARSLAAHGASVVGTARDLAKAEAATAQIRKDAAANFGSFELIELDLASLASVRKCADQLLRKGEPLDVIIANAGVMATPLSYTTDHFEMKFGTNHLGHFVLVNRIAKLLRAGGRLVNLASAGHRFSNVNLDDPNFERTPYDPFLAYGRSKT